MKGGGQSQRCEVRGAEGAIGVECGEGVSLPTEEGVWEGDCAPSPEIFKKFLGFNVFKKFLCSGQRGGASPSGPPKYATAYSTAHTKVHDSRLSQASRIDKNFFLVYMNSTSHDSIIEFIRS